MYRNFFKRVFDFFISGISIIILLPFFLLFTPIVALKMKGNPFFIQKRPGKNGKLFKMIKFRTMTNKKDSNGVLLPDEDRLTKFGDFLRKTSIDELPELFNIFIGDMAIVGPRPQLIKDLVFFNEDEMYRQVVRPGLTGLAQVSGRNNISWEDKFKFDLQYVEKYNLFFDIKIIIMTFFKVVKKEDINMEGMATAEDLGDYLLRQEKISKIDYDRLCNYSKFVINLKAYNADIIKSIQKTNLNTNIDYTKYSVLMAVYKNTKLEYLKISIDSLLNQTLPPDQIVIVFDGEVNKEVCDFLDNLSFKNKNLIDLVKLQNNVGLGLALREGTKYCRNDLIARMDDDDCSILNRMELQLEFLKNNKDVDVVGGNIDEFIVNGEIIASRIVPEKHDDICKYLKKRSPMNHVTVVMKKSKLEESGGYLHLPYDEDYYLWLRMYLAGAKFANINTNLCNVRVGKEMYARRGGVKYFKSEKQCFKYSLKYKIINKLEYFIYVSIRFLVQVLMTNSFRQWIFKNFLR